MANPEPAMSSSLQVRQRFVELADAIRDSLREIACAAGPVCQTLRNQTQSNPVSANAVQLGVGNIVQRCALAQSRATSSVSQTRVLIW